LQTPYDIKIWAYDDKYTLYEQIFIVNKKPKPENYIYTETEIKTWNKLEQDITQATNALEEATKQIGDISTALEELHDYAESLIGGETA
jgi:hypothetical protein